MIRARTLPVVVAIVLLAFLAIGLAAVPTIVRRVAVDRIARVTGRAVSLENVQLNPFTGRVGLTGFRLAQRGSADPALEFERVELRVALTSLLSSNIRVKVLNVTAPSVHVARLGPAEFDFSDLLALIPPGDPNRPSTRAVTLERLSVVRGTVVASDRVVTPTSNWQIDGLAVEGAGLTTRTGAPAGRLTVSAVINGALLNVDADAVDLGQGRISARVRVDGFDVARVGPYVPPTVAVLPGAGRLGVDLGVIVARAPAEPAARMNVSGQMTLDGLALRQRAATTPFVSIGQLALTIRDASVSEQAVTLASITVDDLDVRAVRDAKGVIDLLALAPADAAAPPTRSGAPAATSSTPTPRVSIDDIKVARARFTFRDESVAPVTTLALTDFSARLRHLAWPGGAPLAFEVATSMPSAGRLMARGTATLEPLSAEIESSMSGAPIEPYRAYIPVAARIAGRFNAASRSRVALRNGRLIVTSQGRSSVEGLEVKAPEQTTPVARIERLEMAGIDFEWPGRAAAARITVSRPDVRIERDASGAINLKALFAGPPSAATTPSPAPVVAPPAPPAARPGTSSPSLPLTVEIGAVVIEDGYARFLDRTAQPAFSETVSRLAVKIEGLSSVPGRRAKLAMQAIVGGDAALDLNGEIAPLGDVFADISGDLRDFALAGVNPYADSLIAWIIQRGKLAARVHYRVERGELTADNEITIQNLHVARSGSEDEVRKRIGVPLGLIVALVTDADNNIKVEVPLSGSLESWHADVSDAVWTAVRNAVVNVLAAPFRAIGRLFTGRGNTIEAMTIEPARFAAGSDVIAPETGRHLTQVADFLRRSPAVHLSLASVTAPTDAESLRAQELTARLQALQRQAGLPNFAAAVASEFRRLFPDMKTLPAADQQLDRLREQETVPDARIAELAARRLETVRAALTGAEGIPPDRLATAEAPAASAGEGRVEFKIAE